MKYLVTGGAGFIGSHLVDALLKLGEVTVLDNGSSCGLELIRKHFDNDKFEFVAAELATMMVDSYSFKFEGIDVVFHLAANPDARRGNTDTWLDLEQETIVTRNVLEAMRRAKCKRIVFSSSGTVYGDLGGKVATEDMGPLLPISLYGAGKLASEGLISAFCGTFGMSAVILRLGNVIGPRLTHGCIFDFMKQLKADDTTLKVLGDGRQSKPYIHVSDVVDAMVKVSQWGFPTGQCDVFNLASDGSTSVREIVSMLLDAMRMKDVVVEYGQTKAGWPGDIATCLMGYWKLAAALGWRQKPSSDEAVKRAVREICQDSGGSSDGSPS